MTPAARGLPLLLAFVAIAKAADAQPLAPEEEAIREGVELRKEMRDAEALVAFRRAYALRPVAHARAQMALAEQALGQWALAEADLKSALESTGDEWIERHRAELIGSLGEIASHLATVEVTSNIQGARLRVNGETAGDLPRSVRVASGTVTLDADAQGFEPARRTVSAPPGGIVRERLTLVPATPMGGVHATPAPLVEAPPAPETNNAQRTWGWIALGSAGALLAVGVAGSVERERNVVAYNQCPAGHRDALCGADRDAAQTGTTVAIVGYTSAALLAATGLVLFVTAPRARVQLGGWLTLGGRGASIGARF
jgi:hypothetical protein